MRPTSLNLKAALWGCLCVSVSILLTGAVWAQANSFTEEEWAEEATPQPPSYSTTELLTIDMPPHVSVKVGIDPATISVGKDGVVRYVVVMSNATGTVNAAFEGIRCVKDEVKIYARHSAVSGWSVVSDAKWQPLNDKQPSKHALAIARQGACQVRQAPPTEIILKKLKDRPKPGSQRGLE
jgi:hypothetical protein